MPKLLLWYAGLAVVALISATAAAADSILREAANGKTVRVKRGDLVVVALQENPSTGYHWEVAGIDAARVRILEIAYVAPKPTKPPRTGVPGTYRLTLRIRSAGSSTLRLEYVGPARAYAVGKRYSVTLAAS